MNFASAPLALDYDAVAAGLPGADEAAVRAQRQSAASRFDAEGWPTPRIEAWKYTNLRELRKLSLALPRPLGDPPPVPAPIDPTAHRMVFVDGLWRPELGDGDSDVARGLGGDPGALLDDLAVPVRGGDALPQLNAALAADGAWIRVPAGESATIELVFLASGANGAIALAQPRNRIELAAGATLRLIERWIGGTGPAAANAHSAIALADGAQLQHARLFEETDRLFHLSHTGARIGADAAWSLNGLCLGGALVRQTVSIDLAGPGAACRLAGIYGGGGRQHIDHTVDIQHRAPRTASDQRFRGVLDGSARGVFQGRIGVSPDAQGIDGQQRHDAVLLSDRAEIDTKPELDILADDVKCSHGATAGDLDEDALFYLRTRGIRLADARAMLLDAFLGGLVEEIADETVRAAFATRLQAWTRRLHEETDHE